MPCTVAPSTACVSESIKIPVAKKAA
jgi:hypothetical protein